MKLNRLETHDRLQHLKEDQSEVISRGAVECLKTNPFSLALQEKSPYIYIFAHGRTIDLDERIAIFNEDLKRSLTEFSYKRIYQRLEDVPTLRLLWSPRLSIPEAQENSYLFRSDSKTDLLETIWMIPARELWDQYKKGNLTQHNVCLYSINRFVLDKAGLETPHPKDMPEEQAKTILKAVIDEKRSDLNRDKLMKGLYGLS